MSECLLSGSKIFRCTIDIRINTEVWHKVVSLWWFRNSSIIDMVILLLSCCHIRLCRLDILILSEVWDEVVHLVRVRVWSDTKGVGTGEAGSHLSSQTSLSVCDVLLRGHDIRVLTEMRNAVFLTVNWLNLLVVGKDIRVLWNVIRSDGQDMLQLFLSLLDVAGS